MLGISGQIRQTRRCMDELKPVIYALVIGVAWRQNP